MSDVFAEVTVSVSHKKLDKTFHYIVPEGLRQDLKTGMRVLVPFGTGNKHIQAYVTSLSQVAPARGIKFKSILSVCDDKPMFSDEALSLAAWMKEKYYATMSECLKCIMPAGADLRTNRRKKSDKTPKIPPASNPPRLTSDQSRALGFILERIDAPKRPILLSGVTGSGKTEVYLQVIETVLSRGKQAIVLVPEISLTPQTLNTFLQRFRELVTVTHSRLSKGERLEQWKKARDGQSSIMIGPRSAVFTPFPNLGVIIIDEEHEHTYKSEITPKYSAKEVAEERARLTGTMLILGSATPSVSAFYRASMGELDLCVMRERVNHRPPDVNIVDMRNELALGNSSIFSKALLAAIMESLAANKQIILFLNRRGHSTFISCRRCGHVLRCDRCSVNYTFHAASENLMCHYCGKTVENPKLCPACGSRFVKYFGLGTQKVEEETRKLFPGVGILRMDLDTTRGKDGHEKILDIFRSGEASILIGTQMIAKGLDFPNVTVVGVMSADLSLNNGDFRAGETTFQLLTQVAGRAGRADFPGRVFIQTYTPEHYSLIYAKEQNYDLFYEHEITLRKQMNYPPFCHVFSVMFTCEQEKALIAALFNLVSVMRAFNRHGLFEILGPAPAQISKIHNRYRWKVLIKAQDETKLKNFALYCVDRLREHEDLSSFIIHLTMDPMVIE
ncbi:MAG: primosomal protein N' [Clostridiales bacterium]|jgi:primosomal protein N' (replication factor Y)|nr:primosomal protein N' [Clostridiales bacterium]